MSARLHWATRRRRDRARCRGEGLDGENENVFIQQAGRAGCPALISPSHFFPSTSRGLSPVASRPVGGPAMGPALPGRSAQMKCALCLSLSLPPAIAVAPRPSCDVSGIPARLIERYAVRRATAPSQPPLRALSKSPLFFIPTVFFIPCCFSARVAARPLRPTAGPQPRAVPRGLPCPGRATRPRRYAATPPSLPSLPRPP